MALAQPEKLTIVGCGPGSSEYLTEAGRRAIGKASLLVGSAPLLDLYATPAHETIRVSADIEALLDGIAAHRIRHKIAILVSGDPGLSSLAKPVIRRFGQKACDVIPGISSVQLAFARLGLDWLNARIISAHKGIPDLDASDLAASESIAILAGHRDAQRWINDLAQAFGSSRSLIVCEDLSLPGERVRRVPAAEFRGLEISSRTVVLLLKKEDLLP